MSTTFIFVSVNFLTNKTKIKNKPLISASPNVASCLEELAIESTTQHSAKGSFI